MEITKELVQKDINALELQVVQMEAIVNKQRGSLDTLKNILAYMNKPEEPEISPENKAVQEKVEAEQKAAAELEAVPLKDIAEAVAGPGAVVEGIDEIEVEGEDHE